jgi:ribonuclease VapC
MMKLVSKVIDSWAMVAWVQDEPAAPTVEEFLNAAETGAIQLIMSALNVGETFYILAKKQSIGCSRTVLKSDLSRSLSHKPRTRA